MTGHGRGECSECGFKVTVELSSVNRKQSEISLNLPRQLELLDAPIRDLLNRHIGRGRLQARVLLHAAEGKGAKLHLNTALARSYARELTKLAKELHLPDPVTLDQIARAPGVLQTDEELAVELDLQPAVEAALKRAIAKLLSMRQREGANLEKDLVKRVTLMRQAVGRIRKQAPAVVKRFRTQLLERIKAAGLEGVSLEDERLVKEIVFFADRCDISEELARLQSHFQQFETCRKSREPVGRTLDFLAQEMNREINTIGSKANDSLISGDVVKLKTELERFREQAQNVE